MFKVRVQAEERLMYCFVKSQQVCSFVFLNKNRMVIVEYFICIVQYCKQNNRSSLLVKTLRLRYNLLRDCKFGMCSARIPSFNSTN